mgnify:CR=1 FL=1
MSQKSISGKDLDNAITSDDILGKDVIDSSGSFIGVSEKVFIDKEILDFVGISVDKGFLKKNLLIGKDYIGKIAEHAIFLKIRVAYEIRGMEVFDKNGKKVGNVKDIELKDGENSITKLIVKSGLLKKIEIAPEFIDKIGYNILLNLTKKEIEDISNKNDQS